MSVENVHHQSPCEPGNACPPTRGLARRDFLRLSGAGMAAMIPMGPISIMAGPFAAADAAPGYLVPMDKKLDPAWLASLFEKGVKEVWSGEALENIGMPCGGIGAGQLYLCGDGTLGCWMIFNNAVSNWVEGTNSTYKHRGIPKTVFQGFGLSINDESVLMPLSKAGFSSITFKGEYPIGTVTYREEGVPVEATLTAFSPFIPLNAQDSGLPATIFEISLVNTSASPVRVEVSGWLENAVCSRQSQGFTGSRVSKGLRDGNLAWISHSVRLDTQAPIPGGSPSPTVFADFEQKDYAGWTAEGAAFGAGPVTEAVPGQQTVTEFEGEGLINTYQGGDALTGKLTSPAFTISRPYINLKVGGGSGPKTRICLLLNGQEVRSAQGMGTEQLAWRSWHVAPYIGKEARIVITDEESSGWGHILVDQIEFDDVPRATVDDALAGMPDFGSMALLCLDAGENAGSAVLPEGAPERVISDGEEVYPIAESGLGLVRSGAWELAPGESRTARFVLAWHFPNALHGQFYATRFPDAETVVKYIADAYDRLARQTKTWRDTWYDSSLPCWLLDRLHSTASYLATGTCQWWENGRFWAWEGVNCCEGTCTHVWNYSHAEARLFPELARRVREQQDFCPRAEGGGFDLVTGLVGFRSNDAYAADGQCGTILKAYREHLMSPDSSFLERFWPRIRKTLEFSMSHDANNDGLIEDLQHNTYDINYFGANTFVGSLYLAALRAGEEMAREMGDEPFARQCHAIFESGSRKTLERLWDGEYFIQDVDLKEHPEHQYGPGCLSDQLFGQCWAHLVGLGYIYPGENVLTALRSVWKYNWTPDVGPYNAEHPPFRWFITPGQAGLLTCTWPKSDYLDKGTLYREEVWTGIEYQVASHMIWEGMATEGLAICRAIHDRYHPALFNPYNEVECGDHYARAMASWGVFQALCGFECHGPDGHLGFTPRVTPEAFRVAFTAPEGWGTYAQTQETMRHVSTLTVRHGYLRLRTLALTVPATLAGCGVQASTGESQRGVNVAWDGSRVLITFSDLCVLEEGKTLDVTIQA